MPGKRKSSSLLCSCPTWLLSQRGLAEAPRQSAACTWGLCSHLIELEFESHVKESKESLIFFFFPLGQSLFNEAAVKDILICDLNLTWIWPEFERCVFCFFQARSKTSVKHAFVKEFPKDAGDGASFLCFIHGILMQNGDLLSCGCRLCQSD